jgi:hypothetical protein
MSGLNPANEAVLVGVARVLGLKDAAALAELRPSGLWKLTQRELLEAARHLGLTKVSRLNKEALLARVWEALTVAGAIPPDAGAAPPEPPAPQAPPAPVSKVVTAAPAPAPRNGRASAAAEAAPAPAPAAFTAPPSMPATRPATTATTISAGASPPPTAEEALESRPGAAHKFDVGRDETAERELARVRAEAQAHIPWGYGVDRVTALPVDPERLYAYWEVTDAGIKRARDGLGAAGEGAWLSLRVYDVTGRLFDGTNAHSYFDHQVGRDDRQWFFKVGKPTSQAIVEIGMMSHEGFFVRIARSGRIDFPRREPVGWGDPEWMTVSVATGAVHGSGVGAIATGGPGAAAPGPGPHGGDGAPWGEPAHGGGGGGGDESASGVRRRIWAGRFRDGALGEFEERFAWEGEWEWTGETFESDIYRTVSWEGGTEITSWQSGPFEYPVELPGMVRESYGGGPARVFRVGPRTHVLWGPWQVVIRGLGATAEHQVISRWEVYRTWTTDAWRELVKVTATPGTGPGGASELRLGASERLGRGQSELRLGGASERWLRGASELRLGGSSERAYLGASQWVARGASERRWGGASEWRYLGGSERVLLGASELRLGGASERMLGGGSELRLGGASERFLGGSEGRLGGGNNPYDQALAREPAPGAGGEAPPPPATGNGSAWPSLSGTSSGS